MISLVLYLISGILATLCAFGVTLGAFHLGWAALACVAFGLMVSGLPARAA